jgi:DNA-directed RNA polymerase subunit RPC12/RpoP
VGLFENLGRTMQATDTLKVQCEACGHRASFDRTTAQRLFGEGASPYEIRRRARCRYCQAAGRVTVWI